MRETKLRWRSKGTETTVACFQTGEHYILWECNNASGEMTKLGETFGELEAFVMYIQAIEIRASRPMREALKTRPRMDESMRTISAGGRHVTNLQNDVIRSLMDDYRTAHRIGVGDQLSDAQRREFDRMAVEYLCPDLPKQITSKM